MAAETWNAFNGWFWNQARWLPEGTTWKDLESNDPNLMYPKSSDLYFSVVMGFILLALRFLYERYLIEPIGLYLGVKTTQYKVQPNPILEAVFLKNNKRTPSYKEITGIAKQVDWTERKVQRWLRARKLQNAPTNMKKFRECSYQFLFYSFSFTYGLIFMWDKPWMWDTKKCWEGWPFNPITSGAYWYYMMEMGFYFSLLFTCLLDSKRKDFFEMTLHHILTLGLMSFSWSINYVRIGTLVLILHDIADPWMQIAKMCKYANMQITCEILFVIFVTLWIVTRIFIYPLWILNTVLIELPSIIKMSDVTVIFEGFMIILQILHIIWTYYIVRVAVQRFNKGELTHDTRSDSEGMSDSEDENVIRNSSPKVGNHIKRKVAKKTNNDKSL